MMSCMWRASLSMSSLSLRRVSSSQFAYVCRTHAGRLPRVFLATLGRSPDTFVRVGPDSYNLVEGYIGRDIVPGHDCLQVSSISGIALAIVRASVVDPLGIVPVEVALVVAESRSATPRPRG